MLVDKNEGKSTAEDPLEVKASARIVALGYADLDVLDNRGDSPTACREAISVLLSVPVGDKNKWLLLTGDVQAAFQRACDS